MRHGSKNNMMYQHNIMKDCVKNDTLLIMYWIQTIWTQFHKKKSVAAVYVRGAYNSIGFLKIFNH